MLHRSVELMRARASRTVISLETYCSMQHGRQITVELCLLQSVSRLERNSVCGSHRIQVIAHNTGGCLRNVLIKLSLHSFRFSFEEVWCSFGQALHKALARLWYGLGFVLAGMIVDGW